MTDVPALTRGLQLLELLAQSAAAVPFGDLLGRLGLPRASLARTLAALREAGWVEREGEAGWRPGLRARALAGPVDAARRLRACALPTLEALRSALEASVMLAAPRGTVLVVLASLSADEGLALRPEGALIDDLSRGPWGGVACALLPAPLQGQALARTGREGARRLEAMRRSLEAQGWVEDAGRLRPGVLRVAVPLLAGGRLLGVLGAGAPLAQHPAGARLAQRLLPAAARITAAWGDHP